MSVDTVVVAVVMFYCHFFAKVAVIRSRVTVFSDVRPFLQLRFQCFCIFFFGIGQMLVFMSSFIRGLTVYITC
jgi:hypothetical protein